MRIIIGALALLSSAAAQADVAGTYMIDGQQIVIEANDDGRTRIDSAKPGEYTLLTANGTYIVFQDEAGIKVAAMADFHAVLDDMMGQMWKDLGVDPQDMQPSAPSSEPLSVTLVGEEAVNGRTGKLYREVRPAAAADDSAGEEAEAAKASELVLSDDPTLAPLGEAWGRVATSMPSFGRIFSGHATAQETGFADLLRGKGVLRIDTITLTDVSFDPIEDGRFALPVPPMSKDEVKAMFADAKGE